MWIFGDYGVRKKEFICPSLSSSDLVELRGKSEETKLFERPKSITLPM